ncbi:MAG TPA: rhodanese-like domain-containing protein [Verrucomicrobiae bacterium]|nr:rhodanese-like domain-containing protein [Verrucomicrobiae bacterium]
MRRSLFRVVGVWLLLAAGASLSRPPAEFWRSFRPTEPTADDATLSQVLMCRRQPGTLVVDTRQARYFAEGRIPGAVNMSISELNAVVTNRPSAISKARGLLLYGSGSASEIEAAREIVVRAGLGEKTVIFGGGWREWVECGLPIEKDQE